MTEFCIACGAHRSGAVSGGGYCDICSGVNLVESGQIDAQDMKHALVDKLGDASLQELHWMDLQHMYPETFREITMTWF